MLWLICVGLIGLAGFVVMNLPQVDWITVVATVLIVAVADFLWAVVKAARLF